MLTTRPIFIFNPLAWDYSYLAAAEPDADGWTLDGVDHASASSNLLTITGAGTDVNGYARALPAHDADAVAIAQFDVKIATGATTALFELASATMGVKVVATVTADGTIVFTGSAGSSVSLTMTDTQRIRLMLAAGGWRAWSVDQTTGALTVLAYGTPDVEATNERAYFGKQAATSDANAQYWTNVRVVIADSWRFAWAPNRWVGRRYETEKVVNVAWDGTVETLHGRDDRYYTFTTQALSTADVDELAGYYTDHMAPGRTFYLAEDSTDLDGAWHLVKLLEKTFDPAPDAAVPTHYQLSWKLREVAA